MRSTLRRAALAILAATTPATALSAPAIDADHLTVSGRAALRPGADTPLGGRLDLVGVAVDPMTVKPVHIASDELSQPLEQAVGKSLTNYGFHWRAGAATPLGDRVALTVKVLPFDVAVDDNLGAQVAAHLKLTAAGGGCFPYEAVGRFHALAPLHSGGSEKALAVLVVVASAAAGYYAAPFAVEASSATPTSSRTRSTPDGLLSTM